MSGVITETETCATSCSNNNGTLPGLLLSKEGVRVRHMDHSQGKCGYNAVAILMEIDPEKIFDFLVKL